MVHGPYKPLFTVWIKTTELSLTARITKTFITFIAVRNVVLTENWAIQPGKWIKAHSDSDVEAFVWKNKMHISIVTFSGQRSCLTQSAWACFYYLKPYFSITKWRVFHLGQISTNKRSSKGQQFYHYFSLGNKRSITHFSVWSILVKKKKKKHKLVWFNQLRVPVSDSVCKSRGLWRYNFNSWINLNK